MASTLPCIGHARHINDTESITKLMSIAVIIIPTSAMAARVNYVILTTYSPQDAS